MNNIYAKLKLVLVLLFLSTNVLLAEVHKEEVTKEFQLQTIDVSESDGWTTYYNKYFLIKFPRAPEMTVSKNLIQYAAADSSTFPLSVYSLSRYAPKKSINIEKFVNKLFVDSEERIILWSEVKDTEDGDGVIVDMISSKKGTSIVLKEHTIITEAEVYVLSTLFFTIGVENHDYFTENFIPF